MAAAMLCAATAMPAGAETLVTFDDLNPNQIGVNNYMGFQFASFQPSANGRGMVSPNNAAYNPFGRLAEISDTAPFTFNSGYFTASNALTEDVYAAGYLRGQLVFQTSFAVSRSPSYHLLDFAGIDRITFQGRGPQPPRGINTNVLFFDNLLFNAPVGGPGGDPGPGPIPGVPEPGTWALLILGFGAIGGALRRRRNTFARVVAGKRHSPA